MLPDYRMTPLVVFLLAALFAPVRAQEAPGRVLFTNVHVFDGVNEQRIENANVLIEGNLIKQVSQQAIAAPGATVRDVGGGGSGLKKALLE